MALGGPKNLRQKRNIIAITGTKGILNKENGGIRGQHSTTTPQLKGGHPTIDNTPPNSVAATSQVSETPRHPIPTTESVTHVTSEDSAARIGKFIIFRYFMYSCVFIIFRFGLLLSIF